MAIEGSASIEIEAPIGEVFAVAGDVEGSPRWQPEIKVAECLSRDADDRQVLVRTETDARVGRLGSTLRGVLRGQLVESMPGKLKDFVEGG